MVFMSDPFQRLTAGGTFRRSYGILTSRYDLFLSIGSLIFAPLVAMMISLFHLNESSFHTMNELANNSNAAASFDDPALQQAVSDALLQDMMKFNRQVVVEYIIFILISVAGNASMTYAVAEIYAGRYPTWLASLRRGMSRWCTVLGATLLVCLGLSVGNAVVQGIIIILLLLAPGWVVYVLFVLVAVAWLVFACYAIVSLMILSPVIMVEGKGPIDSLKRCWELSSNNRCYIFCTLFCLAMLYYLVQIILFVILTAASGGIEAVHSGWAAFLVTLPAMVYIPLAIISQTVVYINIRVQQEGMNRSVLVNELYGEYGHGDWSSATAADAKESQYSVVVASEEFV